MVDSALSDISSHLVRRALLEIIEQLLQSKNFRINVTLASKAGENNFIGIIHRISFYKSDEDGNENSPIINLILKTAPQNLLRRSQFVVRPAFVREIYSYEKVNISLVKSSNSRIFSNEISFHCRFYPLFGNSSNQNLKTMNEMVLQSIPSVIARST